MHVSPNVYSQAHPIVLTEMVQYTANNLVQTHYAGIVSVYIDITNNGVTRTLETLTYKNGFSVIFVPGTMELGLYQAGSRHPGDTKTLSELAICRTQVEFF